MKTIKILGTGCPNCKKTETVVRAAVSALKINVNVEKIEKIEDIMAYNILHTPAVVIDEKIVTKGRVPSLDEMRKLLQIHCC